LHRVLVVRCPGWPPPEQALSRGRRVDEPVDDAGLDPRAFEQVVVAVTEFCPRIEVRRPGICAFSARGPARYFGGEAALASKVIKAVVGLGFDCGVGIADGMFAALLASRDALTSESTRQVIVPPPVEAFLAPRSVTVLGEPDLVELLIRLGIRTLGEFAAIPEPVAESRFGPQGLLAHRLASGADPRPLAARPPAADMSASLEFDPPAMSSEQVIFAAKSLAGQMHTKLAGSGLACVRVQVQVTCDDGQEITRLWRHDGLLSDLAVAERVRWQLDGWRADHDADDGAQVGGIALLRLVPDQLVRQRGRQLGLWGDAVISDRVARAAVRVQAMLGHDAVRHPTLIGGRGPAEQALLVPFGEEQTAVRPADRPWPGRIPAPAPATVYPAPLAATVTDAAGTKVVVTGRGEVSADPAWLSVADGPPLAITGWTGPWPVTERWWDPVSSCRKARFQLVTLDGSAWLAVVKDGGWLIEASYD
jgi:protein ImuB